MNCSKLVEERSALQALTETKRVLNKDEIPECKCNRGEDWTEVCGICCENRSEFKGSTNYYGMSLTKGEVIDARACGGIARFANNSCNPNCVVERWEGS
ncbi:hypothetical protein F443_04251 [Phytophthora nicotianae P1569]|uniref:SET domain-containing protein n=1 Tax=Phytophthora nicotianae P1569 TaxID=1317065 RepID=V9FMJ2_PHYNI|nr:hypothetical protein F443_04251 [Phytophthora nicotianae P1569]